MPFYVNIPKKIHDSYIYTKYIYVNFSPIYVIFIFVACIWFLYDKLIFIIQDGQSHDQKYMVRGI